MKVLTKKRLREILKRIELRIRNDDMLKDYAYTEGLKLYSDIKTIILRKSD